jgi:mannose-6-phosphate isomerase-like protein (cupin superfamily)
MTLPTSRKAVHLPPHAGRKYAMGPVQAIFKADGSETRERFSISEWWLDAKTKGPGAHSHPDDDVFYVLEGTMSIFLGDNWVEAKAGSFVLVPGGTTHDFENRTSKRAGMLNVSVPGGFEPHMPAIADWFKKRPAASARTAPKPRKQAP